MSKRQCPLCASSRTRVFLSETSAPVHQNRLFHTEDEAKGATRGDLVMTVCDACGFVFNAAFDPSKIEYDEGYDNSQICSPFFEQYVSEFVRRLVNDRGLRGKHFVEIGCGKGYFLRKLVEADGGNTGIGFDATYEGVTSDLGGRLEFRREFFGGQTIGRAPDVIVCRHVIEHVPDPGGLLRAVRTVLPAGSRTLVFFETPALEWILDHDVIWDFFYEHCSLFTAASLSRAFSAAGFTVDGVERVFDGQYLWLEARAGGAVSTGAEDTATSNRCVEFGARMRKLVQEWRARLESVSRKTAVWGAGAKGATFVNLLDPDRLLIDCVVDLNPRKQGRFIAGTGHPIVAPASLGTRRIEAAILMNPNYESENRRILLDLALDVELVCD